MKTSDPRFRLHLLADRLHRRRHRRTVDGLFREVLSALPRRELQIALERPHDPRDRRDPAKFLDLEVWLREAAWRAVRLGLHRPPRGLRVLDLGSGTGYFLAVCRHLGHTGLGLDVAGEEIFDTCFELFSLERLEHRIEPFSPLPELPWPADLVTAFMTCFNLDDEGRPWGPEPWRFLLDDLRPRLADGGRVALKLNPVGPEHELYPPEVERALVGHHGFRPRFRLDWIVLEAV